MTIEKMTDIKLIAEYRSVFDMIYNNDCYGTNDLMYLDLLERELDRRHFIINETRVINIIKDEDAEDEIKCPKCKSDDVIQINTINYGGSSWRCNECNHEWWEEDK